MTSTASSPAIAAAVAPTLTPTASSPTTTQAAATDFMLTLAQLVGANAAPTPPASSAFIDMAIAADRAVDEESTPSEDAADAAMLGIASLPISPLPPALTAASLPSTTLDGSDEGAIEDLVAELKLAREPIALSALLTSNVPAIDQDSGQSALSIEAPRSPSEALHTLTAPTEANATRSAAHEAPHSRPVHVPVGSQQWAEEIGARLTMMAEAGKQTASLRLTPEHLGPLEIRIAINDDQASVWFGAAHADTRAAIEHALPRLRELFEASGMSLADAGVHREAYSAKSEGEAARTAADSETRAEEQDAPAAIMITRGLVDAYA